MRVHTRIEPEQGEEFEYAGIKVKCVLDDPIASLTVRIAFSIILDNVIPYAAQIMRDSMIVKSIS